MDEFVKRDLHNTYKKQIEEWFIYLDQVEFGKKLELQMRNEVERYMEGRSSIDELIEKTFPMPKIIWENNTL
jgi:hypothetical protein